MARASPSSSSGARPRRSSAGSGARLRTRSAAMPTVPDIRSRRLESANQVSWAAVSAGASASAAASRTASAAWALASSASTRALRSRIADSSAISASYCSVRVCRSSASSRSAESRTSVWMTLARRATSACLPNGRELAAKLRGQVLDARQVGLHRVELAERLLLALAVLEDAGRLLDEPAPLLGRRVQDLVELALADDHVHLAADAGVAEQLLDVEQPAGGRR